MAYLKSETITGYHFSPGKLRFGTQQPITENEVHSIPIGESVIPCRNGFHCSRRAINAYTYYGKLCNTDDDQLYLSRVTLFGDLQSHFSWNRILKKDGVTKYVGRHRFYNKVVKLNRTQRRQLRKLYVQQNYKEFDALAKSIVG
ncbi:MAG TPA: hypothetical protein VJ201_04465 [Candidatus Babeliales bacterium]|nr:hypothetical protein [Candidatus Babeliales bacterium]